MIYQRLIDQKYYLDYKEYIKVTKCRTQMVTKSNAD